MSGGEADGARLLWLARQELLDQLLPELGSEARYRARLIANAMKIAAREMETSPELAAETARRLSAFLAAREDVSGNAASQGEPDVPGKLRRALREGTLDGDPALHGLLTELAERRRQIVG